MALLTAGPAVRLALAALAAATLSGPAPLRAEPAAQDRQAGEHAIKAAFLYNFTKFVEWPEWAFADAASAFHLCVVADERFRREVFATFAGEQVAGRGVALVTPAGSDDLTGCHMVYVARADGAVARRLARLRRAPVLTVGEGRRFLDQGGLIAFQVERDRVRFHVNKQGADAAGLNVSSKLLRVAADVVGAAP